MSANSLAALDDAPPHPLDPAVWSANLRALRGHQPELAQRVERVAQPACWRAVVGLDGFPTYRIEAPDEPARWLAGTAAPRTRAAALLPWERLHGKNPALPTIAAGAELQLLLERLALQQAVYVFEDDLAQLAAVLHTVNFARDLASGRCIFVPDCDEQAFLEQLLERYPGLLPPGLIVTLPGVSDETLMSLRAICESVARRASEARARRVDALAKRIAPSVTPEAAPRLALLALGPSPRSHRLSRELAAAGAELGWATCRCAAEDPQHTHVMPHCERIAPFSPTLAICIDHSAAALPLPLGGSVCRWHLDARNVPDALADDDTIHLAASPRVAEALRTAGAADGKLLEFYWGYSENAEREGQLAADGIGGQRKDRSVRCSRTPCEKNRNPVIVIVGDLPDASAAACGIEQPTHKQLWASLHKIAAKTWESAEITQPTTLLRRAERASGVGLGERALRERMCRIIEHVLIPTIVLERIAQELPEWCGVLTAGKGWYRCSFRSAQTLADDLDEVGTDAPLPTPLAAIFAGPLDPLSPALLRAISLDWPLLIHSPGRVPLTPRLGGVLCPQQHYEPFSGTTELRTALDALRADPQRLARRCARTRAYVQQKHSYARRLSKLAGELGLPCTITC